MKNKITYLLFIFTLFQICTFGQSVAINTDGSVANASAILDIKSTNKGMLAPRMTTVQRTAIVTPAAGLFLYDTDTNSYWVYNGTAWNNLSGSATPGWLLTGNTGTNPASNFIGTTDNLPLRFRVNNAWAGEIHPTSGNVFFGLGSGQANTTGYDNTGIGTAALYSNTSGKENTATGRQALFYNTTGDGNTATGYKALRDNSTGYNITAIGNLALTANTTGWDNTAIGAAALYTNTEGKENTAMGRQALFYNTTGNENTAAGYKALRGNTVGYRNTAFGALALHSNTTAGENVAIGQGALFTQSYSNGGAAWLSNNVAIGYKTLYANQPTSTLNGVDNTAVGNFGLAANTTGYQNTAIGMFALYSNSTGYLNSALGMQALANNTTGYYNTALGVNALYYNKTGYTNTAIGYNALYSNDQPNSFGSNEGNSNTAVGYNALFANQSGDGNTALGYNAFFPNVTRHNTTCIGYNSGGIDQGSNRVEIGNTSVSWIGGQVGWSTFSDSRIKDNIMENVPGLDFIDRLRPVTYNLNIHRQNEMVYKGKKEEGNWDSKYDIEKIKMTGFLAQDVEQAAKESNYDFSGITIPKSSNELYSISYAQFVVPLVKAVQEQQAMIETQQKLIEEQQKKMYLLEKRLAALETKN